MNKIVYILSILLLISSVHLYAQDATTLPEVTAGAGLSTATGFCISVADVNGDDYPDLILVRSQIGYETNRDAVRLFINTADSVGQRVFVEHTKGSGINSNVNSSDTGRRTTLLALADLDNDGDVDMVTGLWYLKLENYTDIGDRTEVLLNDGTGHFTIVPNNGLHELGLLPAMAFSFLDYDYDGIIDLFMGMNFKDRTKSIYMPSYLMKGNGDGTFTNVSQSTKISTNSYPLYGSNVVDWNNDGLQDIITSPYCRSGGSLWRNNGDGTFTDVATSAGHNARTMQGDGQTLCMWAAQPADYDNDGDVDFFYILVHGGTDADEGHSTIVVNNGQSSGYKLQWNLSNITWDEPKPSHSGHYDASWFDLDNDGLLDLSVGEGGTYVAGKDRLFIFKQKTDHTFDDITSELNLLGKVPKPHAMEVLDYDLDGDDDLLAGESGSSKLHLFRNDAMSAAGKNNWVAVKLVAPSGVNRDCIGARIMVYAGDLVQMRDVYAGQGNGSGQQPLIQNFGLADKTVIDSISVRWPSHKYKITTVKNSPINQKIVIDNAEPVGIADVLPLIEEDLVLYPNPAQKNITISISLRLTNLVKSVEVVDMLGRKLQNISFSGNTIPIDLHNVQSGWYAARIVFENGQSMAKMFVKQ